MTKQHISAQTTHTPGSSGSTVTVSHGDVQVIGLDLGGTKLLAGTTDPVGRVGRQLLEASETTDEAALLGQLARVVQTLRDDRPKAVVAIGVPGSVDPSSGRLDDMPNIPIKPGRPLREHLQEQLRCPVVVENDVNLAAMAEARLGAGRDRELVCFLSFGTGVGLGIVHQGRILSGARGRAGEISHLPLAKEPAIAAANSPAGQFEDLVGTSAIRARYRAGDTDVRTIFARAADGQAEARETIAQVARVAAQGLACLQVFLDPNLIVVGGGIGTEASFRDLLAHEASKLLPFSLPIAAPHLGQSAGMIGAVVLATDSVGLTTPKA